MSEKQWVCHISGQGEKWKVLSDESRHWRVMDEKIFMWLPKSEYRLCDPPEVWKDVTGKCTATSTGLVMVNNSDGTHTYVSMDQGYRLRKVHVSIEHGVENWVDGYAFIVEQKVPR